MNYQNKKIINWSPLDFIVHEVLIIAINQQLLFSFFNYYIDHLELILLKKVFEKKNTRSFLKNCRNQLLNILATSE